ncbi:hypothetical protein LTR91_021991 [Friedmanniomyces endolithicus]|uniref:PA14 domain-containing protein n=1 Tax=Friedmanniomyces endolithicus TaxID=329885 RepID=A0AAN6K2W6_9PEZI|nr:hypothetical protein LTR57_017270 [Friedmanniomyces endolithicus]KAK0957185.1 hypothetical protein LTR91_021991 [Friedmanniomyces endolithicus]
MAAALLAILLPIVEPLGEKLLGSLRDYLHAALDDFHRKHPGQTFWDVAKQSITTWATDHNVVKQVLDKLHLTAFVATTSNGSAKLLDWVSKDPTDVKTPSDFAFHFDTAKIAAVIGGLPHEAAAIRNRIFHHEPSAALAGAVNAGKVQLASSNPAVMKDVSEALSNMSGRDVLDKTPATIIAEKPSVIEHVPLERVGVVTNELRRINRMGGLASSPKAVEALSKQSRTDTASLTNIPRKSAIAALATSMGSVEATQVVDMAVVKRQRYENVLVKLLQYVRGTGLAAVDGPDSIQTRMRNVLVGSTGDIGLENLFGSMDQLLVAESATVYSMASYLVDLLEFLRHNSINTSALPSAQTAAGEADNISGTALEYFFRRRPDIGNLLLTQENTDTTIPFIDLSNEIMESFIVNLTSYDNDANTPKQAQIDAFNVQGKTADDLLSQPQYVNMAAYRELAAVAHPMTLPYSQPLDAQRLFLQLLKVSRADLAEAFRPRVIEIDPSDRSAATIALETEVAKLQRRALDNQVACEWLSIIQEDFMILTKQAFWDKEYFESTEGTTLTDTQYQQDCISLKSTSECWGYSSNEAMLSTDGTTRAGLCWVEKQFLPRAGIAYTDLIDIVQTDFINPGYPVGQNRAIFESLQFSYAFLQTLVDQELSSPTKRYRRLADFLVRSKKIVDLVPLLQDVTSKLRSRDTEPIANDQSKTASISESAVRDWVMGNFERMGHVIVLDSGESPTLEVSGMILATRTSSGPAPPMAPTSMSNFTADGKILDDSKAEVASGWVANLAADGSLTDRSGTVIAHVQISGRVVYGNPIDDNGINSKYPDLSFLLVLPGSRMSTSEWVISDSCLKFVPFESFNHTTRNVEWTEVEDLGGAGNIENLRLIHLNGTPLTVAEWDRFQRFIRLWQKLGWTLSDTDRAIAGLYKAPATTALQDGTIKIPTSNGSNPGAKFKDLVTFGNFVDVAESDDAGAPGSPATVRPADVDADVIKQMAAVVRLLPLTGLTLEQLLSLYTNISYEGRTSIFYRSFFTSNLRGTDSAFSLDANGDSSLDSSAKLSDHASTISAAFGIAQTDILYLLAQSKVAKSNLQLVDVLAMANISWVYRYTLLARVFNARITDLDDILTAFTTDVTLPGQQNPNELPLGDPFSSPSVFLNVLTVWHQMHDMQMPWTEFRYIVDTVPTPNDPLAPSNMDSLLLAKALQDAITTIEAAHPMVLGPVTDDTVTASATLVFDEVTVASIISLLHGSTVYSTSAPTLTESDATAVKGLLPGRLFKYIASSETASASIQWTGILSVEEIAILKSAIDKPGTHSTPEAGTDVTATPASGRTGEQLAWIDAVDRAASQCREFFFNKLAYMFPVEAQAAETSSAPSLLASDPIPAAGNGLQAVVAGPTTNGVASHALPGSKTVNSAANSLIPKNDISRSGASCLTPDQSFQNKSAYLLGFLIPLIRQQLMHRSMIDTVIARTGFQDRNVAETMMDNILTVDYFPASDQTAEGSSKTTSRRPVTQTKSENAMSFLTNTVGTDASVWRGYLQTILPASTYVFYLSNDDNTKTVQDTAGFTLYGPPSSGMRVTDWKTDPRTGKMSTISKPIKLPAGSYMLELPVAMKPYLQWSHDNGPERRVESEALSWQGYLTIPASDTYVFSVNATPYTAGPPSIWIDRVEMQLRPQYAASAGLPASVTYCTEPLYIDASKLHILQYPDAELSGLQWSSSGLPRTSVPSTALLSNFAGDRMQALFTKMTKMALLLNRFTLSPDELLYIHTNSTFFAGLNFDGLSNVTQWTRLSNYTKLRDRMPAKTDQTLLELFGWASSSARDTSAETLLEQVRAATSWPVEGLTEILAQANFLEGTVKDFTDERALLRLQQLVLISAQIGVQPGQLFTWARPLGTGTADFYRHSTHAADIQKVARSHFDADSWILAVRPINNTLRQHQNSALIAYLLTQRTFTNANQIVDADSLFEFFLIDVQTGPLVETSRIKQAIASVQTFVQRCFLGLERGRGVPPDALDSHQWDWMQRYTVWEANRKVFLYPENYLEPSLRDDKTDFFRQLESDLLQKNMSQDTVRAAVRSYVYSVDGVANLKAVTMYLSYNQVDGNKIDEVHVIARTRQTPFQYYYTSFTPAHVSPPESKLSADQGLGATADQPHTGTWTGWQLVQVDIPHYNTQAATNAGGDALIGNHVALVVLNGRLLLFIAQMVVKTAPGDPFAGSENYNSMSSEFAAKAKPTSLWDISLSWTEFRDGKWTPRVTCPDSVSDKDVTGLPPIQNYCLVPCEVKADAAPATPTKFLKIFLGRQLQTTTLGTWTFNGTTLSLAPTSGPSEMSTWMSDPPPFLLTPDSFQVKSSNAPHLAGENPVPTTSVKAAVRPMLNGSAPSAHGAESVNGVGPTAAAGSDAIDGNELASDSKVVANKVSTAQPAVQGLQPSVGGKVIGGKILDASPAGALMRNVDNPRHIVSELGLFQGAFGLRTSSGKMAELHTLQAIETPVASAVVRSTREVVSIQDADDKSFVTPNATNDLPSGPLVTLTQGAQAKFYQGHIHDLVSAASGQGDLSEVFAALNGSAVSRGSSGKIYLGTDRLQMMAESSDMFGSVAGRADEQSQLYSIYNWELGLHCPTILADRLFKAQQYDQALRVCQYIFNPMSAGSASDAGRFWTFAPFQDLMRHQVSLETAMQDYQSVEDWRNNALQPHLVARERPQAYMRWVVMTYIRILTAYGDSLFQQNTMESVQMAVQYYVLASHIYGNRGQRVPRRNNITPASYNMLAGRFDAFGNVIVQLEEAFPFSNQTTLPVGRVAKSQNMFTARIFGFAATEYFAVPDNADLRALAATIDDRLFKIRNSQDMNGVMRILPLYDPPIDPALLVQAAAQGLSLSSVVAGLNGTLADCRFPRLLQKAFELVSEVKSIGQTLLSIRERGDSEALAMTQNQQDLALNNITMAHKKLAVDEASAALVQLQYSRLGAVSRLTFYLKQVGGDLSGIPSLDAEFQQLQAQIDAPVTEGGLGLSPIEQESLSKAALANDVSGGVAALELVAGILHALPNPEISTQPLGVGVITKWGPENLAAIASTGARAVQVAVDQLSYQSSNALQKSQYQRAIQDRILQANTAGYEASNIDKQIVVAKIHLALAEKEIEMQQQQIDSAQAVSSFLRSKYTNADLYSWLTGKTQTSYYTLYTTALTLATKAQKAFELERPNRKPNSYIQPGYWDASRDGMLAGEALYLALKQLESAALDDKGYTFEVTKSVSLRQLDALQLLRLRELGTCDIEIPETLFDMDFPGHYMRRIRSVSVTIPCLVGPYTTVNATLTLLSSKLRVKPAQGSDDYAGQTGSGGLDSRFVTGNTPISSIAVCNAQNDAGAFQLDFGEETLRYLPFEGAGTISKWRLELPPYRDFRQFAYDTITDVILQMRYTSIDGGMTHRQMAQQSVMGFVNQSQSGSNSGAGLRTLLDLKNDYASAWSRLVKSEATPALPTHPAGVATPAPPDPVLLIPNLSNRLPFYVQPRTPDQILATDIWVITASSTPSKLPDPPAVALSTSTEWQQFSQGVSLDSVSSGTSSPTYEYQFHCALSQPMAMSSWNLKLGKDFLSTPRCYMVIGYTLKPSANIAPK